MKKQPTDLRAYRRQTERRLLIGIIVCLLIVGSGLIGWLYGPAALLSALTCLLPGAGAFLLLWLLLTLLEKFQ